MRPDIDCTGMKCPEPVMRTRKMMEEERGTFAVLVDNNTARDNVRRAVESAGRQAKVTAQSGRFLIEVGPAGAGEAEAARPEEREAPRPAGSLALLVTRDSLGSGEPELGRALMKMFLYTSSQVAPTPSTVAFMNSGVRLVTENEETIAHVRALEEAGAEVLVCGTCLDYYGLTDSLAAGRVSNMYEIYSSLIGAGPLVSI